jgi:hypothetical protein
MIYYLPTYRSIAIALCIKWLLRTEITVDIVDVL